MILGVVKIGYPDLLIDDEFFIHLKALPVTRSEALVLA
jgi:hypothetical protein